MSAKQFLEVMRHCASYGNYPLAIKISREMALRSYKPDSEMVSHLVVSLIKGHQIKLAFRVFTRYARNVEYDSVLYGKIIRAARKTEQTRFAEDIYNEMHKKQHTGTERVYSEMIIAFGQTYDWQKAVMVVEKMAQLGVRPTPFISANVLYGLSQAGLWQSALKLFYQLKSSSEVCTSGCNVMLHALAGAKQWQHAMEIFEDMIPSGIPRDLIAYNTMIDVLGKSRQWRLAMKIFLSMKRQKLQMDLLTYTAMISALEYSAICRCKNTESCSCNFKPLYALGAKMFADMKASELTPDVIAYSALISLYEKSRLFNAAYSTFQDFLTSDLPGDCIIYSAVISSCVRDRKWELAFELFRQMQAKNIDPDKIAYSAIVDILTRNQQFELAIEMTQEMLDRGLISPEVEL